VEEKGVIYEEEDHDDSKEDNDGILYEL